MALPPLKATSPNIELAPRLKMFVLATTAKEDKLLMSIGPTRTTGAAVGTALGLNVGIADGVAEGVILGK